MTNTDFITAVASLTCALLVSGVVVYQMWCSRFGGAKQAGVFPEVPSYQQGQYSEKQVEEGAGWGGVFYGTGSQMQAGRRPGK